MVIDMNVSRLETIEQIREFLNGTVEVAFSNPAGESTLRTFVTTVIIRDMPQARHHLSIT